MPTPSKPTIKVAPEHVAEEVDGGIATLKATNISEDTVWLNCKNQLERSGIFYNQIENKHKAVIATAVLSHTTDYHSKQALDLRDTNRTLQWEKDQVNGGSNSHIRQTISSITFAKQYPDMGIETTWKNMTVDAGDARVAYADDRSGLLWDMALATAREWEQRTLQSQCNPVRRKILLMDRSEQVRNDFIGEFRRDCTLWDKLKAIDASWAEPFQNRSIWQRMMPTQFRLCLEKDGWEATRQLLELARNQSTRFISQLMVEEFFNKVKADVSCSMNSTCTPQRAMATVIDKKVLTQLNQYEEVDRETQITQRGFQFDAHTFTPQMRPKCMDDETRNANFRSIVGTGTAEWFSPNSTNTAAPFCDILACRDVEDNISKLQNTWLSRLCSSRRMLVRRKGADDWMLPIGEICSVIVKVWPVAVRGGVVVPVLKNDTKSITITITAAEDWEACPIRPVSPMRRAIMQELAEGALLICNTVRIKDFWDYGTLQVGARILDIPQPLLEMVARKGFLDLGWHF